MHLMYVVFGIIISASGVFLELYSIKHDVSGLCLDADPTIDKYVTMQNCSGEPFQVWDRIATSNETYFIINTGNKKYLNYERLNPKRYRRYVTTAPKEGREYEEWWHLPTGEIINLWKKYRQLKITINRQVTIGQRLALWYMNLPDLQRFIFVPVSPHTTSKFSTPTPTPSTTPSVSTSLPTTTTSTLSTPTTETPLSNGSYIRFRHDPNLVLDGRDTKSERLKYFTGSPYQQWREVHMHRKFTIYNKGNNKVLDLATNVIGSNIVTKLLNSKKKSKMGF